MMKKHLVLLFVFCVLLSLLGYAMAEEARDITKECKISTRIGSDKIKRLTDRKYASWFSSGTGEKAAINVTAPEGEEIGGVYIQWANRSMSVDIQTKNGTVYETISTCNTMYLADYIPLPKGITDFRIIQSKGAKGRMLISELTIFSKGDVPQTVQQWNDPWIKADMLVLSTHPDDELIFLGGTIPYYAGEKGMAVQVAYVVPATAVRKLELLDGLWHCGVRNYPVMGNFADKFSNKMADIQRQWGKKRLEKFVALLYRQFQPEVVVTQAINGEYGHGAHKAVSDAAQKAIALATKSSYEKESVNTYGTWEVKKLYLHLYGERSLKMDWRKPLSFFNGKTAFDVADEAFQLHRSQQKGKYFLEDFGPYDNSLYGLFHSTVGDDAAKNDFFENISSY